MSKFISILFFIEQKRKILISFISNFLSYTLQFVRSQARLDLQEIFVRAADQVVIWINSICRLQTLDKIAKNCIKSPGMLYSRNWTLLPPKWPKVTFLLEVLLQSSLSSLRVGLFRRSFLWLLSSFWRKRPGILLGFFRGKHVTFVNLAFQTSSGRKGCAYQGGCST